MGNTIWCCISDICISFVSRDTLRNSWINIWLWMIYTNMITFFGLNRSWHSSPGKLVQSKLAGFQSCGKYSLSQSLSCLHDTRDECFGKRWISGSNVGPRRCGPLRTVACLGKMGHWRVGKYFSRCRASAWGNCVKCKFHTSVCSWLEFGWGSNPCIFKQRDGIPGH